MALAGICPGKVGPLTTLIELILLLLVIISIIFDGLTLRDVLHALVARESQRRGWKGKGNRTMRKITKADASAICTLYAQGELSYRKIAKKYDVNPALIGRIVRGEEWRTSSMLKERE